MEVLNLAHLLLGQQFQPDSPVLHRRREIAKPLFAAVQKSGNPRGALQALARGILQHRACFESWKFIHGYRSATTSLMECECNIASFTALAISSLWSINHRVSAVIDCGTACATACGVSFGRTCPLCE